MNATTSSVELSRTLGALTICQQRRLLFLLGSPITNALDPETGRLVPAHGLQKLVRKCVDQGNTTHESGGDKNAYNRMLFAIMVLLVTIVMTVNTRTSQSQKRPSAQLPTLPAATLDTTHGNPQSAKEHILPITHARDAAQSITRSTQIQPSTKRYVEQTGDTSTVTSQPKHGVLHPSRQTAISADSQVPPNRSPQTDSELVHAPTKGVTKGVTERLRKWSGDECPVNDSIIRSVCIRSAASARARFSMFFAAISAGVMMMYMYGGLGQKPKVSRKAQVMHVLKLLLSTPVEPDRVSAKEHNTSYAHTNACLKSVDPHIHDIFRNRNNGGSIALLRKTLMRELSTPIRARRLRWMHLFRPDGCARTSIGEIAWAVVRYRKWDDSRGIATAQMRRLAFHLLHMARRFAPARVFAQLRRVAGDSLLRSVQALQNTPSATRTFVVEKTRKLVRRLRGQGGGNRRCNTLRKAPCVRRSDPSLV
jgi:hypothetical protein